MANDLRLYDKLLELPLFVGMSKSDLSTVVAHTKFGFHKYEAGKTIIKEDDPCEYFYFLLNGKIKVESKSDDHGYKIEESISAPDMLQPERLFGLSQRFSHTFIAEDNCNLMTISKEEVTKLSDKFLIFRLNIINIVSSQYQKLAHRPWRRRPENLKHLIIRFFEYHSIKPAGEKVIYIKMERLAEELNDSRLDISRALNEMQAEGQIILKRGRIIIPALERLLMK